MFGSRKDCRGKEVISVRTYPLLEALPPNNQERLVKMAFVPRPVSARPRSINALGMSAGLFVHSILLPPHNGHGGVVPRFRAECSFNKFDKAKGIADKQHRESRQEETGEHGHHE